MNNYKPKKGYVLVLRTNDKNNQSRNNFQYPTEGYVETPDWKPIEECGNGLHGALKGVGDSDLFSLNSDAIWMVLEVKENEIIDLRGKVKFKGGNVIYSGNRQEVTKFLYNIYGNVGIIGLDYHTDKKANIIGGDRSTLSGGMDSILKGGRNSTLIGGNVSILTGGDNSTLKGGRYSTLTGGDNSTLTGGDNSTLTGGDNSTLTGGNWSTLTGGEYSTLKGGRYSTLIGGNDSTLVGDVCSTLTGGVGSILTGGDNSTLTGGDWSILNFRYWDGKRNRIKIAYVGEDGIKPNTKYKLNDNFKIEEIK